MAYLIRCAECDATFTSAHPYAETCGTACRSRRYRRAARERTARTAAEIERAAALLASLRAASVTTPED